MSGQEQPSVNDVRLEMLREVMDALGWEQSARPQTPESLWRECLAEIRDKRWVTVRAGREERP